MRVALGLLGLALLIFTVTDLLWTTFLEGAGPLTLRVCNVLSCWMLRLHRRSRSRRWVTKMGLVTVMSTVMLWALFLWIGWSMVFNGGRSALVSASTGQPADGWSRVYFAGYTITTLGLGDYQPRGAFWQITTAVAAGSGFFLFGLAVSYIVPVVSAATQKRQVAVNIWSLGRTPADIIMRAWNGIDTTALGPHLVSLTSMLALLGESHLTYPVLHYFNSTRRSSAVAPGVAALDEALTILECGLQKGCSLDLPSLGAAREAISEFLETLKPALISPANVVPPSPVLTALREMGVPVVEDALFGLAVAGLADRRRLLLALVIQEGWTWKDVWPGEIDSAMGA